MIDNLIDVTKIYDLAEEIASLYRHNLDRLGVNASGELSESSKNWDVDTADGRTYQISLNLAEQWKYVEYGRRPGKFPPISAIRQWIDVKPVIPRPLNKKLPTKDQLAFLIARKIANDGIPARPVLADTVNMINPNKFSDLIFDVIYEKINSVIDAELK